MNILTIGISGASTAGKSTLADALRDALHMPVQIVRQDDFYKEVDNHEDEDTNVDTNWDRIDCIDSDRFVRAIHEAQANAKTLLIVEGFRLYEDPRVDAACNVRVHLHIQRETMLRRRQERDDALAEAAITDAAQPQHKDKSDSHHAHARDPPGYVENVAWPEYERYREKFITPRLKMKETQDDDDCRIVELCTDEREVSDVLRVVLSLLADYGINNGG